jgi:hypothetical protein
MSSQPVSSQPYGPQTTAVRRFLQQLAGLSAVDRAQVVERYIARSSEHGWSRAERALGEAMVRGDREAARDALSGPLMQLVRNPSAAPTDDEAIALAALDPIAEPALAALLALVVRDLLAPDEVALLLSPFAALVTLEP